MALQSHYFGLLLLCTFLSSVNTYNILCVFPIPSQSHKTLGKGIVNALLDAGHKVSWVTPYPEKNPDRNLRIIEMSELIMKPDESINMFEDDKRGAGIQMVKQMSRNITTKVLQNPTFRDIVMREKFDAVITEHFFDDINAGLPAVLQVPWLLLNGMVMHPHIEYLMDSVSSPAVLPFMMHDYDVPMSFFERVHNSAIVGLMMLGTYFIDRSTEEAIYKQQFEELARARGVPLPPFPAAVHNASVVFVNSHPAIAHAQSLPQNVIEIGGFHLDENTRPLPQDLQTLLDKSTQGVIYFSMGSVLRSQALPEKMRNELLEMFSKVKQTVLWKFEGDIKNLPKNVHVRAWMPQQSILAHPNVKLFITHGGMLSSTEAIHFGVPLLAVPIFGDQPSNAARAVRRGYARKVPFSYNVVPELSKVLDEMLNDDVYYKTAKKLSKVFRNRLVSPSKTIAYYTELAIETGGAPHLRSKALLYPCYQRLLLDQFAALLFVLALLYYAVKMVFKCLCGGPKKVTKKTKRN